MDGSRNVIIQVKKKRYHILYVGIHGGSGMGANEPHNGRWYLVSSGFWEKNKESYCMVHDSILPRAWDYYEKNGVCLAEEKDHPGRATSEALTACLSRLDPGVLARYGAEEMR